MLLILRDLLVVSSHGFSLSGQNSVDLMLVIGFHQNFDHALDAEAVGDDLKLPHHSLRVSTRQAD